MVEIFTITKDMPYPPQSWKYEENDTNEAYIDPETVISYDQDTGKPHSRYKNDIWRFTWSLSRKKHKQVAFTSIKNQQDKILIKRLMFIIMHLSKGKKGSIKSPISLKSIYIDSLLPMHRFAAHLDISIEALLNNPQMMRRYITTEIKSKKYRSGLTIGLINFLARLQQQNWFGIVYKYDSEHLRVLAMYYKEYVNSQEQSECIPPRILRNAQRMRWEHVDIAWKVRIKLAAMIDRLMIEPLQYAASNTTARSILRKRGVSRPNPYIFFGELANELELDSFCDIYTINGRKSLVGYLSALSKTCRHLIYGYTGMRNDEGCSLWIGCYHENGAGLAPVINGIESKNGIPIIHPFVTIKQIKKVIDLQTVITRAIAKHSHSGIKELPLLFNPGWISGGRAMHMEVNTQLDRGNELPLDKLQLIITKEDVEKTLKATEPDRDWDNDPHYHVGMVWKFNWHQYRRSVAVYSLRSGLVNITALGTQYRQLLEATTIHYGNGHYIAQPLEGTDSKYHVSYEAERLRDEHHARALWRDMLINLDRPESGFAPADTGDTQVAPSEQIEDIDGLQTIAAKMKRGEIGHTNTAIGSCKSLTPCDGHMMLIWKPCLECAEKVPNINKVDHLIDVQGRFVEKVALDMPGSIELRDQQEDLEALKEFRKILGGENG
jgi:hypothetical protein